MADLTTQHTSASGVIFYEKWTDNGDGTYSSGDGGGASYFDPTTILASPVLGLSAQREAFAADSFPPTLTDWSGSGNHPTQGAAANRAQYKTGIMGSNGKAGFRFDKSNDQYVFPTLTLSGDFTILLVLTATGDSMVLGHGDVNYQLRWLSPTFPSFYDGIANPAWPGEPSIATTPAVCIFRKSGETLNARYFQNGTQNVVPITSSAPLVFSTLGQGSGSYYGGDLGELWIWNTAATIGAGSETELLSQGFMADYGL